MNKKNQIQEDLQNEKRAGNQSGSEGSGDGRADGEGNRESGEQTGTDGKGSLETGANNGGNQGGTEGAQGGSEGSQGDAKSDLLTKIRERKSQKLSDQSDSTIRDDSQSASAGAGESSEGSARVQPVSGTSTGQDRKPGSARGTLTGSHRDTDDHRESSETSRLKEEKPAGVKIDKIPSAPLSKGSQKPITIELEEVITKKESAELLPRAKDALQLVFKGIDSAVTFTTTDKTEAYIFRQMDDEDLNILASIWIEYAQVNRVVATALRRMTRAHKMLAANLILMPKFVMLGQHYLEHGFSFLKMNFFGKK